MGDLSRGGREDCAVQKQETDNKNAIGRKDFIIFMGGKIKQEKLRNLREGRAVR